jgi:hypothetical protein
MLKRIAFYSIALLIIVSGCNDSGFESNEEVEESEPEPPSATQVHEMALSEYKAEKGLASEIDFLLSSSANGLTNIELSWEEYPGADSYRVDGFDTSNYGGDAELILSDGEGRTAFAWPTEDPRGEFIGWNFGEFGFALFQVHALDVSGNVIASSNVVSYGAEYDNPDAFYSGVGLVGRCGITENFLDPTESPCIR